MPQRSTKKIVKRLRQDSLHDNIRSSFNTGSAAYGQTPFLHDVNKQAKKLQKEGVGAKPEPPAKGPKKRRESILQTVNQARRLSSVLSKSQLAKSMVQTPS